MLHHDDAQQRLTALRTVVTLLADEERKRLTETLKQGGDAVELWERDARAAHQHQQLQRYESAGDQLMFGHLQLQNGEQWFLGRMGLTDPQSKDTLLVDWRAPVARPFYTATPLNPANTQSRSTIQTQHWQVTRLHTEHIAESANATTTNSNDRDEAALHAQSGGISSALLSAVSQQRSERMNDIVATIQHEQDRIIRSEIRGTLLVQGGPGTGKTAVALHRAAYLLYEHRERLAKTGVLIIGPNPAFLQYISAVLPSLGEDSAILTTVGELLPGIHPNRMDAPEAARLKGRLDLAQVLKRAVQRRQFAGINNAITITLDNGETVALSREQLADLKQGMRRVRKAHNQARGIFSHRLRRALALAWLSDGKGHGLYSATDPEDVSTVAENIAEDAEVRALIERCWPALTPSAVLASLATDRRALRAATTGWCEADRELFAASIREGDWTEADVPLLDELQELLGVDPEPARLAEARRRAADARELDFAQGVLEGLAGSWGDDEGSSTHVSAADLAERQRVVDRRTVAERAWADDAWVYGHIIVDEAQELTPMALRAILRRCPAQSLTLVGDIHQASLAEANASWEDVFAGQLRRVRQEVLTVNYRTPAEVMRLAASVLRAVDAQAEASASFRSTGRPASVVRVAAEDLVPGAVRIAESFLDEGGTVAVICGAGAAAQTRAELLAGCVALGTVREADTTAAAAATPAAFGGFVVPGALWCGDIRAAKGLEFDRVVVVEPGREAAALSAGELRDLYVALTRATQDLTVLHAHPLPECLAEHA